MKGTCCYRYVNGRNHIWLIDRQSILVRALCLSIDRRPMQHETVKLTLAVPVRQKRYSVDNMGYQAAAPQRRDIESPNAAENRLGSVQAFRTEKPKVRKTIVQEPQGGERNPTRIRAEVAGTA